MNQRPTGGHPPYPNPQLVEVLCEVLFVPQNETNWMSHGVGPMFEALKDAFPVFFPIQQVEVQPPTQIAQQTRLIPRTSFRFSNKEPLPDSHINISEKNFSFHMLNNYQGWDIFKSEFLKYWGKAERLILPSRIQRIGLRYVNKIPRTAPHLKLGDWIATSAELPEPLIKSGDGFQYRCEFHSLDGEHLTIINLFDLPEEPQKRFIIFDIDNVMQCGTTKIESQNLEATLGQLHDETWKIFDRAKTPLLENLLQNKLVGVS